MAEYICNKEFLNEFYSHLAFNGANIHQIDDDSLLLSNLKVLNLCKNNLSRIQNIPESCLQLYLDFNQIKSIDIPTVNVEFLSISHNLIQDHSIKTIAGKMPKLRCLNISYNQIKDIRAFVSYLKECIRLKMIICRNNPISLLPIYWQYITNEISLNYFDNEKYKKP